MVRPDLLQHTRLVSREAGRAEVVTRVEGCLRWKRGLGCGLRHRLGRGLCRRRARSTPATELTPVTYDPFAPAAAPPSSGGTLTPVDYDPFAPQTTILGEIGEVGRGIPAGAVEAAGTALRGIAANQPTERFASYLDEIESGVVYRTREREGRVPITDDQAYTDILGRIADDPGMFQSQQLWLRNAIEKARAVPTSGGFQTDPLPKFRSCLGLHAERFSLLHRQRGPPRFR